MTRIVTIVAENSGEQREVFHINQTSDKSLYLNFGSRFPDSHISLHESGVFHVTRCKDGKRIHVTLPEGQPLSKYKGCSSPNQCIIDKALLSIYKKSNRSGLIGDIFAVDLSKFKTPLVAVTTYLFDHGSGQIFDNEVSKYMRPIRKVVNTIILHIGLVAHESQAIQPSSP